MGILGYVAPILFASRIINIYRESFTETSFNLFTVVIKNFAINRKYYLFGRKIASLMKQAQAIAYSFQVFLH